MARVLKDTDVSGLFHDAIPVSWKFNTPETIEMLCRWADWIVVMEPYMQTFVKQEFREKVKICDVGPDIYGSPMNKMLQALCEKWARSQGILA